MSRACPGSGGQFRLLQVPEADITSTTTTMKPTRKLNTLEKLLKHKSGVSIEEMITTGWQQNSVRGAIHSAGLYCFFEVSS